MDITRKIDAPFSEFEVDKGFGIHRDGTFQVEEKERAKADESDGAEDELQGFKTFDYDGEIKKLF